MILTLARQPSYKEATFGNLDIDGGFFCHTYIVPPGCNARLAVTYASCAESAVGKLPR